MLGQGILIWGTYLVFIISLSIAVLYILWHYAKCFPFWPFSSVNKCNILNVKLSHKHFNFFVTGGHEVSSSISNFDFHINVCRGITAEKTGDTQDCPANSSMCRIDKKLQTTNDLGNINYASNLRFSPQNDIILVYNTTQKVDSSLPITTITFKCPKQMVSEQCKHAHGDCNVWRTFLAWIEGLHVQRCMIGKSLITLWVNSVNDRHLNL